MELRNVSLVLAMLFVVAVIVGGAFGQSQAFAKPATKKAIIVVSFGTTYAEARKESIDALEDRVRAAFPDYEVRRAFTSNIVMKVLKERDGIHVDTLEQALLKLKNEGYTEVVVQSTHLTPGEEYDKKIVAVVQKHSKSFDRLVIGRPALVYDGSAGQPNDFAIAVEALKAQMPILQLYDRAVVFMGHGSPHQSNPAYQKLQEEFDVQGVHAVVGVVEETDHPNFEDAVVLLKKRNVKRVILMPLMIVAGDHANNDMAGDEPDSWKNLLNKEGFTVVDTYLHGLGANEAFQNIYIQHIKDAVNGIDNG